MIVKPDWLNQITLSAHEKSNPIEVVITPTIPGQKNIIIHYFYKYHWLTQVKHTVNIMP